LLVNLRKNIDMVRSFLQGLPSLYEWNSSTQCCIGAALNAAYELIVLLQEVLNLSPASDYYKSLALECTGHQAAVDLFLLSSRYADLSTLGGF
uniref:Sec23_trunk domain-containing protein n=1 Tax=Gongylonema pulchrum TaxID=637853 RepID=A0A183ERF9_9BILA